GDKAFSLQAKAVKGAKITYKTSDKKVAVADKKGKVTIKGTGIATITIKATASGYNAKTLKVTVKVSPSKASALSLKTLRGRKLKVSWKKDGRATGYQVQYCTSKAFKKGVKTITISKNKTVTKTISKLTKGKRYYVRVRAYKSVKVNKKTQKLYGAWSSVKRSGKIRK
ncbi:MAG: fibronectin type III domain-containing protein, partial [Lachnospiraceae bacterium]|nr:fibronectin type III domain-containing protein [Lachnospiraceae bacterium]